MAETGGSGRFGAFLKLLRNEGEITLREFCRRTDSDPGNVSRIERGKLPPPQNQDVLATYAATVELKPGSDAWTKFFDLAAADRGIVPQDIMSDKELVDMLPAFYRTLRDERPTEEQLRRLIRKMRSSGK